MVRTVDNFGRTGEPPSHPELLDYLASELNKSGWSTKALIRQIVLSRTFGLSSSYDAANATSEPENRLLWRAHRRRLDPESFRDAMLAAAGKLDLASMDSSVSYLGDQATAVGANNDELVIQAADATAKRILADCPTKDIGRRIDRIFELILQSHATPVQRQEMESFLAKTAPLLVQELGEEAEVRALSTLCHALFASSRFLFLE